MPSYYTALFVLTGMAPLALRTYPTGVCNCNCMLLVAGKGNYNRP